MHKLNIKTEIESLPQLYSFCEEQGVDNRIMLALEEAFVNVVSYSGASNMELTYERKGNDMIFVLEDNGVAFDPTAYDPACETNTESLQMGGQGIRIMRSMMDNIHYKRENGKNILTLSKSNN